MALEVDCSILWVLISGREKREWVSSVYKIEQYSPANHSVLKVDHAFAVDILDLLTSDWQDTVPKEQPFLMAGNIYDIPITTIKALKNLNKIFPGCFATVYNSSRAIKEVTEANTGIEVVVAANFVPMEIKSETLEWKKEFTRRAFVAGCVGAVVDFDPTELAAEYPDHLFFRNIDNANNNP